MKTRTRIQKDIASAEHAKESKTVFGARSEGELVLACHLRELGLDFKEQVRVCPDRRWLWDFYLPAYGISIEVDGYFKGRHGKGWGSDNEKANVGTMLGYRVLRFSSTEAKNGKAKLFLQEWIGGGK